MDKTFNILIDLSRTAEFVIDQLGYDIVKEEKSDCGLYVYYTVRERE